MLVAKEQQRKERRKIFTILGVLLTLTVFILFFDGLQWQMDKVIFAVVGVVFPLSCIGGFIVCDMEKSHGQA